MKRIHPTPTKKSGHLLGHRVRIVGLVRPRKSYPDIYPDIVSGQYLDTIPGHLPGHHVRIRRSLCGSASMTGNRAVDCSMMARSTTLKAKDPRFGPPNRPSWPDLALTGRPENLSRHLSRQVGVIPKSGRIPPRCRDSVSARFKGWESRHKTRQDVGIGTIWRWFE